MGNSPGANKSMELHDASATTDTCEERIEMSRQSRRVRAVADTEHNEGFRLWRIDRQIRPCFGTTETDFRRKKRTDLEPGQLEVRTL